MKALSIKNPWAYLCVLGIKDIENRSWRTNFRGKIYVHASGQIYPFFKGGNLAFPADQWAAINSKVDVHIKEEHDKFFTKSAIIGEVEIIDCVVNHPSIWAEKTEVIGKTIEGDPLYKTKPIWNWALANPVLYEKPILNVKGKLSFWEPDIDIQECIGCSQKFDLEEMEEDDGGEKFCPECWEVLSPVMAQEAKENATESQ
ncbi:ASCH domain-containing protein [Flavobacterium sp. 1355]|uniref:ASCH domain-containing protein n=1 Tax=Flavobacterium sp. 1355 TaxID=2806571 RepID=UPI001AE824F4|nr:ASCH domain-containing protein [Flavobacterium sp. 1355]MBP1222633.1 hypothetical protein [Flavobacterium sp. 1355]